MWLSFWDPFLEGSKERNRRVTMNLSDIPLGHNRSLDVQGTPPESGHSLWEVILIVVTTGILSLVTVMGNLLVMVSFKVNRELRTVNNYFLLSLAGADLIIGAISMNLYTTYIVMGRWAMGSVACDLWLALDYVASNASVMNLLVISFDRYFSITRPLTYRAKRTPKRAAVMIGLAWAISFVLWAPAILFWQNLVGERTVPEDDCYIQFLSVPIITFGTAIAAFYLPVTIMVTLYWRIYQETQKRAKELCGLQASEFKNNLRITPKTIQNGGSGSSSSSERSHPVAPPAVAIVPMKACCFPRQKTKGIYSDQSSNGSWNTTEEEEVEEASADSLTSSEGEEQPFEVHSICSVVIRLPMISTVVQPPRETGYQDPKAPAKRDIAGEKSLVMIPKQPPEGEKRLKKAMIPLRDKTQEETKRQIPRRRRQRSHLSKRKTLSLVKERKAARMLSAILLGFIITWTPYNIMVLVSTFCQHCIPPALWKLGYWLCYVNSTVNPMCYALCNRSFRTTFRMLLQCHWNRHHWRKMPKKMSKKMPKKMAISCAVSGC